MSKINDIIIYIGSALAEQDLLLSGKNERKFMKVIYLLCGAVILFSLWSPSLQAQCLDRNNPIYKELADTGRMTTGEITSVYDVPCVEVKLRNGESIMTLVQSIPSLKQKSH